MTNKPALGKMVKLPPEGYCYSGFMYKWIHGKDGLKWDNDKQQYIRCPFCKPFK